MKIEAKALLLDHAAEQLDAEPFPGAQRWLAETARAAGFGDLPPPRFVVSANSDEPEAVEAAAKAQAILDADPAMRAEIERLAVLAIMGPGLDAFVPGPPVPAPPPQDWPHAAIVRRSIAGDDDDAIPRLPSLRGFLAAAAASDDWGVPVRSTSDPERFGKGKLRGGGGRPHDPCTGREHYALAQRELARVASGLTPLYGLDGAEQMAAWATVAGAGRLELRNIHVGRAVDSVERDEVRAAKRTKRGKRGAMQPPQKRRAFLVPERKTLTSTEVALELRRFDVFVTPHQVGLVCRRVTERVREAFEAKGWIRAQTKRERTERETKGATMAALNGHDLQGWKPILEIVGCSANTARALMARKERRLPVVVYLGTPNAKSAELRAWQDAEVAAALAEATASLP